ncbi:YqcI/YcgG family protein [Sediminibacillus massiliensis]|uniref:YqcI/YcgG family protein n=1 Tax=Sediminibacillus massiliensis TaxID=1926277 RepID=UPI0009886F87|nr:YqcI/YcgG family protein [Sediminibacillus massiliensis]
MNGLYHDTHNRSKLSDWEKTTLRQFKVKMSDNKKPFPCIPATIGFSMNQLRYGFIGDPRMMSTIEALADILTEYTKNAKEYGDYTSLIVFYELPEELLETCTVTDYEQLFWRNLSGLSAIDTSEWPGDIPTDPNNPIWEFCFHGERYFMYCATPAHINRKSRYFDTMMLAITPRWVLQKFNKNQTHAEKIKRHIRKRLSKYDSTHIHPDLNSYGAEDNYEWRQYFLRDDDTTIAKCPYHQFINLLSVNKK